MQNCYNTGDVSGNDLVGGVVGDNLGTVQNCYNTGAVSGSEQVGGVVGVNNGGAVTDCYFLVDGNLSGIGLDNSDSSTTEKMTSEYMQSSAFTDTLNNWVLDNRDSISGLYYWLQETATSYPALINALTFDDITDYVASFDSDFDELATIYFNGVQLKFKQLDANTYEIYGYPAGSSTIIGKVERGSVVVTLYEEFLRTLPAGDYDLSVTFSGEQVETAAAVVVSIPEGGTEPETETDVPATGDNSNATLWVATMLLSVGAMAVTVRKRTDERL